MKLGRDHRNETTKMYGKLPKSLMKPSFTKMIPNYLECNILTKLRSSITNGKSQDLTSGLLLFLIYCHNRPYPVECGLFLYAEDSSVSFQLTNIKIIEYRLVSNIILTLCNIVLKLSNIVLETFWVAF